MSGKRFKGKLCVYCSRRLAVTGDHVFAREFFLPEVRDNLPQVPTCDPCNNEKSKLEHYLTALLPFGGRHAHAHENLESMVPGRLAKNLRLARELNAGRGRIWYMEDRVFRLSMTVPIDAKRACELFAQIGRGLAWYHWGTYLQPEQTCQALFLSKFGREYFSRIFTMNAANRVEQDLGKATVNYSGVQAVGTPQLTLWRMRFYGGISLSGDPQAPNEVSTEIAAITGPKRIVGILPERTQWVDSRMKCTTTHGVRCCTNGNDIQATDCR